MPVAPGLQYQSPPNSGGNDGALPAIYDQSWPGYTNLTPAQILAFQGFPQDLLKYAGTRRWLAQNSGTSAVTSVGTVPLDTQDYSRGLIGQIMQAQDKGIAPSPVPFISSASGGVYMLTPADVTAVYTATAGFIAQLFAAHAQIITGINNKTITSRAQIDAAIATIAPNSPSAKGQG